MPRIWLSWWKPVLLVAIIMIAASGCGSSAASGTDDSTTPPLTNDPTTSSSPPTTTTSINPAVAKSEVEKCLKQKGLGVTHNPTAVTKTRYGALDAEFKQGEVIVLFTGSTTEADRAAKAEEALAKAYGVDASDLIKQHGTITYFWDGTFTHDQKTIDSCLPSLG